MFDLMELAVLKKFGGSSGLGTTVETEEKILELMMTDGDMVVNPTEGKFLSKVTVEKPADLIPENIKSGVSIGGVVGELETNIDNESPYDWIMNDGDTHIWINLSEERKSPVVGIGVNGTVLVDWGDGSEPSVLTGTSTSEVVYTSNHEYECGGDYIITLKTDNEIGICSSAAGKIRPVLLEVSNHDSMGDPGAVYRHSILKIECSDKVTFMSDYALAYCTNLQSVYIAGGIKYINGNTFYSCYSLESVHLPNSIESIGRNSFSYDYSLINVNIPDSVKSIGMYAFEDCRTIKTLHIPNSVTSISAYAFSDCNALSTINIPNNITTKELSQGIFSRSESIRNIVIPDGIRTIRGQAFESCFSLSSITIPSSIATIYDKVFSCCEACRYYDFSRCSTIPALGGTSAFANIPVDCEIRVPMALVDEWKAATNWATYADYIVGV